MKKRLDFGRIPIRILLWWLKTISLPTRLLLWYARTSHAVLQLATPNLSSLCSRSSPVLYVKNGSRILTGKYLGFVWDFWLFSLTLEPLSSCFVSFTLFWVFVSSWYMQFISVFHVRSIDYIPLDVSKFLVDWVRSLCWGHGSKL